MAGIQITHATNQTSGGICRITMRWITQKGDALGIMKIKHFAGYGCVNATKVKDNTCRLHVKVKGNHEWGLGANRTWDEYGLFNWLVKRFDKKIELNDFHHAKIEAEPGYEDGTETCDFYFWY